MTNILQRWDLSADELTLVIDENPSLRGFMSGYIAEFQLKKFLKRTPGISNIIKYDDHDRKKKNDISFIYKGHEFTIEVKSLQTNSIRKKDTETKATFQCDASDSRTVKLPNGEEVVTTCLLVGEFDILAVNLFGFTGKWDYAFALNKDLPRSSYKKYTPAQQKYLLSTSMKITWPVVDPYSKSLIELLEELVKGRGAPPVKVEEEPSGKLRLNKN
jgi:hypothetical protein